MDMVEVDNVIHCSPKEQGYTRLLIVFETRDSLSEIVKNIFEL